MPSNDMINDSRSTCYMMGDSAFYILDEFSLKNMGEIIGQLGNLIKKLPTAPVYDSAKIQITSPYDTSHINNPIIDIFIDSNGGATRILQDITTLLNIAKSRGAIIRTTVLSSAYSCGSLLAIQGTPGFRIMAAHAKHLVHFGSMRFGGASETQIQKEEKNAKHQKQFSKDLYSTYTKMPPKTIQKLCSGEGDFLGAEQCLENGLCDWIIGEHGKLIGRTR